ncbi:MAG TPA: HIT domain-containing protein [Candidatus Saccharimonadales bacterium]|jgi:histidine triad (HIT) family protein
MQQDSIFTKIIKGELPCHKVYEDAQTIAFLPLHPIAHGHVLVVPKLQIDQFYDLPAAEYQALMATVQKVAQHLQQTLGTKRVGLKIVGLDVPHAHIHVIAFNTLAEYNEQPDETAEPDHLALASLAKRLML